MLAYSVMVQLNRVLGQRRGLLPPEKYSVLITRVLASRQKQLNKEGGSDDILKNKILSESESPVREDDCIF
jgi:hypothetical protein